MPEETRQKLSNIARKRFSQTGSTDYLKKRVGNDNPNFCGSHRINSRGYAVRYELGKEKLLHRELVEKRMGRALRTNEHVHHIDGNKLNNNMKNLIVVSSTEHRDLHTNLESVAFQAIKYNIIQFDAANKRYFIDPSLKLQRLEQSLGFEDVALLQGKSICPSRLDVDITSEVIRGIKLKVPLLAANMSTVTNADFCIKLEKIGAMGVLHRANNSQWIIDQTRKMADKCTNVAVSIGVGDDQFDLMNRLVDAGANIVVVDIAHGYSDQVINLGKRIRKEYKDIKIVVGNTINTDMMYEVAGFADAVKIGIANGLACETKNTAGCTEKQFSSVYRFREVSKTLGLPVISDGGIREPGDFTKAILAGANGAMAGSIFARCPESAAPIINVDGKDKKVYSGMASRAVQNEWRGGLKEGTCPEGKTVSLDIGEPVVDLVERYSGALRSGITYVGASNIANAQDIAEFIRV